MTTSTSNPAITRFISSIASPFKAAASGITDFYITLERQHACFAPGDPVKGHVHITTAKIIRITHIVVCLQGFVKVLKNDNGIEKALKKGYKFPGTGRGQRGPEYFGNGLATIFEDEIVLCGKGPLDSKEPLSFPFELCFPFIGVPSSLDFERGTISYMITATLTRHSGLKPTSSCHLRVPLRQVIDIAHLPAPKPRTISLQPITQPSSRRSRSRHQLQPSLMIADGDVAASQSFIVIRDDGSSNREIVAPANQYDAPRSPTTSVLGAASVDSSSIGPQRDTQSISPPRNIKPVTTTVELLRSGCLPGKTINVRIKVDHNKPVKSLHGIILTFYRTGRLDTQPVSPIDSSYKGKEALYVFEDALPKSRTGLGGLNLSSSGTNRKFRINLAQEIAPLIVDPTTLTAVIEKSIRVPDELFPTISNVPGDLISFKYYLEVIIDIKGKLAESMSSILSRLSMMGTSASFDRSRAVNENFYEAPVSLTLASNYIADTDQIKRHQSVIGLNFEIIVGTHDSKQSRARRTNETPWTVDAEENSEDPNATLDIATSPSEHAQWAPAMSPNHEIVSGAHDAGDVLGGSQVYDNSNVNEQYNSHDFLSAMTAQFVPPVMEEAGDEKTRLGRMEELLLPGAPPVDDDRIEPSTSTSITAVVPTEDDLRSPYEDAQSMRSPAVSPEVASSSNPMPQASVDDDKQEMERQRLLTLVSAPEIEDDTGTNGSLPAMPEPSAPVLADDDDALYDDSLVPESLPRYQR